MTLNRFLILQKNSLNEHSFIESTLKILVLLSAVLFDHRYSFRLTRKMWGVRSPGATPKFALKISTVSSLKHEKNRNVTTDSFAVKRCVRCRKPWTQETTATGVPARRGVSTAVGGDFTVRNSAPLAPSSTQMTTSTSAGSLWSPAASSTTSGPSSSAKASPSSRYSHSS